ncbi:MAG: FtsX-like permease family protein, partial [Sphingobacteriaceae bacterium]
GKWKTIDEDLGNSSFDFFVKLKPGTNPQKTGQFFSSAFKAAKNGKSDADYRLQKLTELHLIGADGNASSLHMVQIFMLVVILLLTIASINYVNLSTARSLIRAKEVSIRKIIGAQKQQLFFQFLTETCLLFLIATFFAVILIYLLTPLYNQISGKNLAFDITNPAILAGAGLAIFGTLIASSIYPAILLSSFQPIQALKGKITSGIGIAALRKGLVVFQFSISVILLVCTIVMGRQLNFIKNKDIGYNKSYVFSVPLTQEVVDHLDAVKAELKKETSISNVAASNAYNFSDIEGETGDLDWPEKTDNTSTMITQLSADKDLIPTMQIKLLQGQNFSGLPVDSSSFIINEAAVKKMGLKQPVGQQITFHDHKGTIIGVVKDFNFKSLKEKISPLIFFTFWNYRNILYVRTTGAGAQQAIAATAAQYKKYAGDSPFGYHFLDQSFDAHYKTDQRAGTLFNVFAGIAIFISCLGLFGLATYTAQVKFKEIGIRKVLGASVAGIVKLISVDFIKLVLIAILIAVPVAWWAMHKWLESFAYQTNVSWWIFALAGMLALLIALATVSFQAVKAALANPVKSLRSE